MNKIKETGLEGMNCIDLTQDKGKWPALTNTVMNLWISQTAGNFLTS
jgi:hypothetical protein